MRKKIPVVSVEKKQFLVKKSKSVTSVEGNTASFPTALSSSRGVMSLPISTLFPGPLSEE